MIQPTEAGVADDRLRESLGRVIAAAADPYERCTAVWCRPTDTPEELRSARRASWIDAVGNGDADRFAELLSRRAISDETFDAMIGEVELREPVRLVSDDGHLPGWAQGLIELLDAARTPVSIPTISLSELGSSGGSEPGPLEDAWRLHAAFEPLLAAGVGRIERLVEDSPVAIAETAQRCLLVALAARMAGVAVPTLASEPSAVGGAFEALGLVDMSILEIFLSGTPDAGLWLHVIELAPVLGRLFGVVFSHWCAATTELFDRLAADRDALSNAFGDGRPLGPLTRVEADAGDLHRDGRAVQMLSFASGTKIVYKPKNLDVGAIVLALLGSLTAVSTLASVEPRRIVTRPEHTWEAFVDQSSCTPAGARRFYVRYGMIMRFLQQLRGHDITCENLIANGEHPEVIDLETMFRPVSRRADDVPPVDLELISRQHATAAPTAMITASVAADAGRTAVDMSPLASANVWDAPFRAPTVRPRPDGSLRLEWDYVATPRAVAVPTVDGVPVDPHDHLEDVLAGYEEMDAIVRQSAPRLLAELRRCATTPVRLLNRASHIYARLISASVQPARLLNGVEREICIDRLWKALEVDPYGGAFIADEVAAVRQLDIPLMQSLPGSTDAVLNDGSVAEGVFAVPALDEVIAALDGLEDRPDDDGPGDDALASARTLLGCIDQRPLPFARPSATPRTHPRDWAEAAAAIGRFVAAAAVRCDGDIGWVGISYQPTSDMWVLQPLRTDLLNGTGGIAVALAEIARVTGDPTVRACAEETVAGLLGRLDRLVADIPSSNAGHVPVGGLVGVGSALYGAAAAGASLDDASTLAAVAAAVDRLDLGRFTALSCDDLVGGRRGLLTNLSAVASLLGRRGGTASELADHLQRDVDSSEGRPAPYPEGAWVRGQVAVDERAAETTEASLSLDVDASELSTRDVLERLERAVVASRSATGPVDDEGIARFAGELLARRRTTGSWFPDLRFDDRYHLSAVYGICAVGHVLLAASTADAALPVRATVTGPPPLG